MSYAKRRTPFMAVLILMFCIQSAGAQSTNIDDHRMNRDIKIMENILQEMFKIRREGGFVRAHSGGIFNFGGSNDIRGTHLPGYGVIFTIPGVRPGFTAFNDANGDDFSFNFEYGNDENGGEVTEKSVTNKIIEFLQDYGSTISQLSDDDRVMVIYNSSKSEYNIAIFSSSGDDEEVERPKIPTISVVATKSNLQAYRSGDLSSTEFRNRLDISTAESNGNNQMDMKVMANIFETAFKESDGKAFRVSGSVDYLHLDNFGALFSFDARYSSGGSWAPMIEGRIRILRDVKGEARVRVLEEDAEEEAELEKKQAEEKQAVINAYDQFLNDLKEYLVDYGRTLSSVESGQRILVSVTLNDSYEEVPERIDMQVQKSTLEAMERGDMDREEAIDQVQVREY